ncbi:MAG: FG-GAP-like repeat-containing protein [Planctomycetes bacterium]|nr:FG-GAP-like repeat-containing protein [Planctomycetota bacterium]
MLKYQDVTMLASNNRLRVSSVAPFVLFVFALVACDGVPPSEEAVSGTQVIVTAPSEPAKTATLSGTLESLFSSQTLRQEHKLVQYSRVIESKANVAGGRSSADGGFNAMPTGVTPTGNLKIKITATRTNMVVFETNVTNGEFEGTLSLTTTQQKEPLKVEIIDRDTGAVRATLNLPPTTVDEGEHIHADLKAREDGDTAKTGIVEMFRVDSTGTARTDKPRLTVDNGYDMNGDGKLDNVSRLDFADGMCFMDANSDGRFGGTSDRVDINGNGKIDVEESGIFSDWNLDGDGSNDTHQRVPDGARVEDFIETIQVIVQPSEIATRGDRATALVRLLANTDGCAFGVIVTLTVSAGTFYENGRPQLTKQIQGTDVRVDPEGGMSFPVTIVSPTTLGDGIITFTATVNRTSDKVQGSETIKLREFEGPVLERVATTSGSLSGAIGAPVVITGKNFDPDPMKNLVTFGGIEAQVIAASPTELSLRIPEGALDGPLGVTVSNVTSETSEDFDVLASLQSIMPSDKSNDVSTGSTITVVFSESVSGISASSFKVKDSAGNAISGSVSPSGQSDTFTFTPASALTEAETYSVSIATYNIATTFTCSQPPDLVPPTIVSTTPSAEATGVSGNNSVLVEFSEQMDPASFTASSVSFTSAQSGLTVTGNVRFSDDGKTFRFVPLKTNFSSGDSVNFLLGGTTFTLALGADVKDISGNSIGTALSLTFTTGITASDIIPRVIAPGGRVHIRGGVFSEVVGENSVLIGGQAATVLMATQHDLLVRVPDVSGTVKGIEIATGGQTTGVLDFILTTETTLIHQSFTGLGPTEVAIHPSKPLGLVTNQGGNTITEIDLNSGQPTGRSVVFFGVATDVIYGPEGKFAYATNFGVEGNIGSNVMVIDLSNMSVVGNIRAGRRPCRLAITPDGSTLYATNFDDDTVSAIDIEKRKVREVVDTGFGPNGVVITQNGEKAYVTNYFDASVTVIDPVSFEDIGEIPVEDGPVRVEISPDGLYGVVTNHFADSVTIFRTKSDTVIQTFPVPGGPLNMVFSPDGATLWISLRNANGIVKVNLEEAAENAGTALGTITAENAGVFIPTARGPSGLAMSEDGSRLLVACTFAGIAQTFFVKNPAPAISSISRQSADPGTTLTLTGNHLGMPEDNVKVELFHPWKQNNTLEATIVQRTPTRIKFQIPEQVPQDVFGFMRVVVNDVRSRPRSMWLTTRIPTVEDRDPHDDADNVPNDAEINVIFSEPLDPTSVNSDSFKVSAGGVSISGAISLSQLNSILTFTPAEYYPTNAAVTVTLSTELRDLDGHRFDSNPSDELATEYVFSFRTTSIEFDFPEIESVTPNYGPREGGTTVTIACTHLTEEVEVFIGGAPLKVTGVNLAEGTITAITPPRDLSFSAELVVLTSDGLAAYLEDAFTYFVEGSDFQVNSISPKGGPIDGGNTITIRGIGFQNGAQVFVDDQPAATVFVRDPGSITIEVPAGLEAGTQVDVSVMQNEITKVLSRAYTYVGTPVIYGMDPVQGDVLGGEPFTVYGENFIAGAKVVFGGRPATGITVASPWEIRGTTPPATSEGSTFVAVVNPDGSNSGTSGAGMFMYSEKLGLGRIVLIDDSGIIPNDRLTNVQSPMVGGQLAGSVAAMNSGSSSSTAPPSFEGVLLVFFVDDAEVGEASATSTGSFEFTIPSVLAEGYHSVGASVESADGRYLGTTEWIDFEIDVSVPAAPSGAILPGPEDTGLFQDDGVTSDNQPTFLVDPSEDFGTVNVYEGGNLLFQRPVFVGAGHASQGPQNLVATPGNSLVILSWDVSVPSDIQDVYHRIYRSAATGNEQLSPEELIAAAELVGETDEEAFVDETAVNGTTYFYVIVSTAVDSWGEEHQANSAPIRAIPQNPTFLLNAPSAPQTIEATGGPESISLSFGMVPDAIIYKIRASQAPFAQAASTDVEVIYTFEPYFQDDALEGETVYFEVYAINQKGLSLATAEVSATGLAASQGSTTQAAGILTGGGGGSIGSGEIQPPQFEILEGYMPIDGVDYVFEDGSHVLTFKFVDAAGNESADGIDFTYVVDTASPAGGAVGLRIADYNDAGIDNADNVTNIDMPDFEVTITEEQSYVALFAVPGGGTAPPMQVSEFQFGGGLLTLPTTTPLPEGIWNVVAKAVDLAGNEASLTDNVTVAIDLTPPMPPTVGPMKAFSDTGASNSDGITMNPQPVFDASIDGQVGYGYVKDSNTGNLLANFDYIFQTNVFNVVDPLVEGVYDVVFEFYDRAGNVATGPSNNVTFEIDVTPPTLTDAMLYDLDSDGFLDAADVTFDEPVTASMLTAQSVSLGGISFPGASLSPLGTSGTQFRFVPGLPVRNTALAELTFSSGATGAIKDVAGNATTTIAPGDVSETDMAPPVISQPAHFLDINDSLSIDAGDFLIVTFSETVNIGTGITDPAVIFNLPVTGDTFGTGATFAPDVSDANVIWITLGTNPDFQILGNFRRALLSALSPSGIDVLASIASGALFDDAGNDAIDRADGAGNIGADGDGLDIQGTFAPNTTYIDQNLTEAYQAVAHGDFNKDGFDDVVLGGYGTSVDRVMLTAYPHDTIENPGGAVIVPGFNNDLQVFQNAQSRGFAVFDFDRNGWLDIASTESLWLNNGSGLTPPGAGQIFGTVGPSGSVPNQTWQSLGVGASTAIDHADFDKDGDEDLVLVYNTGNLQLLVNDGAGAFSVASTGLTASNLLDIAAVDFDLDGDVDIVTAGANGDIGFIRNDLPSGLTQFTSVTIGAVDRIEVGLLNGDGLPDLVYADSQGQEIGVVLSNGPGTWNISQRSFLQPIKDFVLHDIDRDGDLDIVAAPAGAANVIFYNIFAGLFDFTNVFVASGPSAEAIAVFDINGDGSDEIFVTTITGSPSTVLDNVVPFAGGDDFNESGTVRLPGIAQVPLAQASRAAEFADFDRDGDLDLVVVSDSSNPTRVYENNGLGIFTIAWEASSNADSYSVAVGDFNHDGLPDVFVGNLGQNQIYGNAAAGGTIGFTAPQTFSSASWKTKVIEAADFNQDGDLDVLEVNDPAVASGTTQMWAGNGASSLTLNPNWSSVEAIRDVGIGDFDSDGKPDMFAVLGASPYLRIWRNDGGGSFTDISTAMSYPTIADATRVEVADIDRNGNIDVVIGRASTIDLWYTTGANPVNFANTHALATNASDVLLGDMDGDGWLDTWVIDASSANVLLLGDGYGNVGQDRLTLGDGSDFITPETDSSLCGALGDVDGDGDLDLFVGNAAGTRDRIYINRAKIIAQ